MATCKDCLHFEVCAYCVNDLPICDSFKDCNKYEEVKYGRWLPQILLGERVWDCSECATLGSPRWKRCPVCEAKMEGTNDDGKVQDEVDSLICMMPTVDAVEVTHIEEVKQAILQTFDNLIATHRDISNSQFANSAQYLNIPESSNDYNWIYADAMEVTRRFVDAALTDLCSYGGGRGGK